MKNDPIFAAMKAQLTPSEGAQRALWEALRAPVSQFEPENEGKSTKIEGKSEGKNMKKMGPGRYLALVACAALVLCTWPAYQHLKPQSPKPHSYVMGEGTLSLTGDYRAEGAILDKRDGDTGAKVTTAAGEGDHDVAMSWGALRTEMREYGFTDVDIDTYLEAGHHMTWALWHSYSGEAQLGAFVAYTAENQDRINEIIAAYGLDEEDAPNTGDLPGGAYIGEVAVQSGAEDYDRLMVHFKAEYGEDGYPDWYGGGYLDDTGRLVVRVVTGAADDKNLLLKIQDWAGSEEVAFTDGKYSLAYLRTLQKQVEGLEELKSLEYWGCGVYETLNQVVLEVPAAAVEDETLLSALAKLDPDDDALLVRVSPGATVFLDEQGSVAPPAPGGVPVLVDAMPDEEQPVPAETEQPAAYDVLPALVEDGEADLIANEPWLPEDDGEDPPQQKEPAIQSVSQTLGKAPAGE